MKKYREHKRFKREYIPVIIAFLILIGLVTSLVLVIKNKKTDFEVKIDEKRIYAPSVVIVKNGEAISLETGIVEKLTDPYMELTDEIKCEIKEAFACMFDKLESDENTCSVENKTC